MTVTMRRNIELLASANPAAVGQQLANACHWAADLLSPGADTAKWIALLDRTLPADLPDTAREDIVAWIGFLAQGKAMPDYVSVTLPEDGRPVIFASPPTTGGKMRALLGALDALTDETADGDCTASGRIVITAGGCAEAPVSAGRHTLVAGDVAVLRNAVLRNSITPMTITKIWTDSTGTRHANCRWTRFGEPHGANFQLDDLTHYHRQPAPDAGAGR